jgi:hypothetical protein
MESEIVLLIQTAIKQRKTIEINIGILVPHPFVRSPAMKAGLFAFLGGS